MKRVFRIRRLPNPAQSLRAITNRAPQAEVFVANAIAKSRPAWVWLLGAWRRLATGAVIGVTIWLSLHVMFGANGMVIYRHKRAEYQQLQKENQKLQQENDLYNQRIKSLRSDPQTIEKEAREQLHYTRPGEIIYVAPAPAAPQHPPTNAAHK